MANDWTDEENDLLVADYFAMLADDYAHRPYNKAEHNRQLQTRISRTRASIEFKHRNVSAALKGLGEEWLTGYLPAFNFQDALENAVARWLAQNPWWLGRRPVSPAEAKLREPQPLWPSAPPTLSNQPPPQELEKTLHIARKFDVAGRDERNRALGRAGEERVFEHERLVLTLAGRHDLARKTRWVSVEDGDGAGYDIASFLPDGRPASSKSKPPTGGSARPSTSPEPNWQSPRNGGQSGACLGCGTSRGNRRRSSCTRRSMRTSR